MLNSPDPLPDEDAIGPDGKTVVLPWTCAEDCTHFTSCCIGAPPGETGGGFSLKSRLGRPPGGPYGEPGAGRMATLLKASKHVKVLVEKSTDRTLPTDIDRGDVIAYYNESSKRYSHCVLYLGNSSIAAHTPSRHPSSNATQSDWDYKAAYLIFSWTIFHFRT
jgi:hypothetical protein